MGNGKFINLIAKECYLPNFFFCYAERDKSLRSSHRERNKNNQPFQKTYGIHCNFLSFIIPMENFTTFNVGNPVCEIITHIFFQDECSYLLLDYTLYL